METGQTPYKIGKEVAEWLEKLFKVAVKPKTIESRAYRQKLTSNEVTHTTNLNDKENGKNKKISLCECPVCHQLYDSSSWDIKKPLTLSE